LAGGVGQWAARSDTFQGAAAERAQVAVALQRFRPGARVPRLLAATGKGLAEVRVAYRHPLADPTGAVADRAGLSPRFLRDDTAESGLIAVDSLQGILGGYPT
jgi:hypothetical protein